ncbi:MAG: OmpA family protein [Flavobacteriales bacterium]
MFGVRYSIPRLAVKKLAAITILLLSCCGASVTAQELVVNGDLSTYTRCPKGPVTKKLVVDGKVKAAQGNPDLYADCSATFGVPSNWSGHQAAFDGGAYAGLVLTTDMPNDCGMREYLQFPLSAPLENGRRYRLTYHVSPSEHSGYVTDAVGAIFSDQDCSRKGVPPGLREHAAVENPLGRIIRDTTAWTTVTGVYNAMGGERFVVIGNFHGCNASTRQMMDSDKLRSMKRKAAARMDPGPKRGAWHEWMSRTAYVYLDGVSLVPDITSPETIIALTPDLACRPATPGSAGPELIPDPGFERNDHPTTDSWRNASDGTPDLFNGMTGLYLFSAAYRDNREYIRIPLADTLNPCTSYRISFDVDRNNTYAYSVDAIGIAVTDTFSTRRNRDRMDFPWAWRSPVGYLLAQGAGTITVCGTFTPKTCATQLLLGNFDPDSSTTIVKEGQENDGPFAYYFVDNVHLNAVATDPGCIDPCPAHVVPVEEPLVEHGPWPDRITLHFDSDSDQPLELDAGALDRLAEALRNDPELHVRIIGHTDDSGTGSRNEQLAQARADRLAQALTQRGILTSRITTVSAGSRTPMADNGSPEGRATNRRVEVLLER